MNVSVDKKTKAVHKNNSKNKKKKQHTQTKSKHKKRPSQSHRTPTFTTAATSIVIATHQPILQDAPIVFLSTPIPTVTPLTLPNHDDSPLDVANQDENQGFHQVEETGYMASAAAIHRMEDTESNTTQQQQSKSVSTTTQVTQIAAPVIGVFGGIALIAAAMLYVVKKRKRNSMLVQDMSSNKKLDFDNADAKSKYHTDVDEMHDISLLDEDEATMVMGQPPKLTPANTTNNTPTTMNRQYLNHSTIINVPENHPVNNLSNMTDRSHYASRANSLHLPPLSYQNSCRSSTTSTVYTDALMSPISSVSDNPNHMSSFLMIAERQQLQHQRPSILDHFNNNSDIKPSQSSPIETYKAQLIELTVLDNEDEDDQDQQQEPPNDPLFPFSTVIDLTEVY